PFGIGFWRIQQCQVSGLSGLEIKSSRFLKVESHSAFRYFSPIQQPGAVGRYRKFFVSHKDLPNSCAHRLNTGLRIGTSTKQNRDTFRSVSSEMKRPYRPRSRLTVDVPHSATGRIMRACPLSNTARPVAWKGGRLRTAKVFQALC